MDVFRILVTAVLAGIVIYFITSLWAPIFSQQTNLSRAVEDILMDAQGNIGESAPLSLTAYTEQSLYARNYDNATRSVSFACAGSECCPMFENCTQAYASTEERIRILRSGEIILTARCMPNDSGIHACKVYIGEKPAQVKLENVTTPSGNLNTENEIVFQGKVRNVGELSSGTVHVKIEMWGKTFESGKEVETLITKKEQTLESLDVGKTEAFSLPITISNPGNYRGVLSAQGNDAGMDTREFSLKITGELISLCVPDYTKAFEKTYDAFIDRCREKRYCTDCDFSFACRQAWQREAPVELPNFYDTTRGENGFTYVISPAGPTNTC